MSSCGTGGDYFMVFTLSSSRTMTWGDWWYFKLSPSLKIGEVRRLEDVVSVIRLTARRTAALGTGSQWIATVISCNFTTQCCVEMRLAAQLPMSGSESMVCVGSP